MPKRMQRDGGMPDGPAPDAANGDSIVIKIEGEAGPAISKRGRQLRQVRMTCHAEGLHLHHTIQEDDNL